MKHWILGCLVEPGRRRCVLDARSGGSLVLKPFFGTEHLSSSLCSARLAAEALPVLMCPPPVGGRHRTVSWPAAGAVLPRRRHDAGSASDGQKLDAHHLRRAVADGGQGVVYMASRFAKSRHSDALHPSMLMAQGGEFAFVPLPKRSNSGSSVPKSTPT